MPRLTLSRLLAVGLCLAAVSTGCGGDNSSLAPLTPTTYSVSLKWEARFDGGDGSAERGRETLYAVAAAGGRVFLSPVVPRRR